MRGGNLLLLYCLSSLTTSVMLVSILAHVPLEPLISGSKLQDVNLFTVDPPIQVHFILSSACLTGPDGQPSFLVSTINDLHLLDRILKLNPRKSRTLANPIHEILKLG